MPQVDAVGAFTNPAQRREAEELRGQRALVQGGGDDRDAGRGQGQKAPVVQVRGVVWQQPKQSTDTQHAEQRGGDGERARRDAVAVRVSQRDGQRRAQEDAAGAGVGALVDAGGVSTGVEQEGHPAEGHRRQHERADDQRGALAAGELEQDEQNQRPEQVELFLHGQRPHVIQRRVTGKAVKIGLAL